MSQTLQIILSLIGLIAAISTFIYWHFKTVNGFKDEILNLKLDIKDLEKQDELQQQTIDQLNQIYPAFYKLIDNLKP